jgi:hypothetical protein
MATKKSGKKVAGGTKGPRKGGKKVAGGTKTSRSAAPKKK